MYIIYLLYSAQWMRDICIFLFLPAVRKGLGMTFYTGS